MKFGPIPIDHAEGTIVAHSTRLRGRILKKGHILCSTCQDKIEQETAFTQTK